MIVIRRFIDPLRFHQPKSMMEYVIVVIARIELELVLNKPNRDESAPMESTYESCVDKQQKYDEDLKIQYARLVSLPNDPPIG